MPTKELFRMGAREARRALGDDPAALSRLWASCRERIAEREPEIGAFTCLADGSRRPGQGELSGIPVGVKDIIETIDMPTAYGSAIYAGYRPPRDAYVVTRLRRTGALIAGKTETSEFAGPAPARTRNPHKLPASPGGSSAGSAAAVAAGMVPLALGSQTAGSVIRPASFCGVVGFKPSYGVIDTTGIRPAGTSLDTAGVFARHVEDAAWLAAVLANDPALGPEALPGLPSRLGIWRPAEFGAASETVASALDEAATAASRGGFDVCEMVLPPVFHRVEEATRIIFAVETLRANASELLHAPDRVSRQLTEIAARGATVPAESLREARQTVREAGAALAVAMAAAEVPVLLTPATADEAPDSLDWTGDAVFNRVWTAIGVPAITVPQRYGPRGLPVGLQIVAGRGHDATLLAAAGRMEHVLRRGADAVRLVV